MTFKAAALVVTSALITHCGPGLAPPIVEQPAIDAGVEDAGLADAGVADAGVQELLLAPTAAEATCLADGWALAAREVAGQTRKVLWKGPAGRWARGAILVLHGGGGQADHFCTGGALVQPQIAFARDAVLRGFAVFVLDATTNVVTDSAGRPCGKRFDFSVLPRPNLDLPYVEWIVKDLVPARRPSGSRAELFITGLSTGGYMTTRAATHFDDTFTAFAPLSAGDPYGTDTICDPALSPRESAVGILVDRETRKQIVEDQACANRGYPNESPWSTTRPPVKPTVKQFHDEKDGIVDVSCMRKLQTQLQLNGYPSAPPFLLQPAGPKNALLHLWRASYNAPLLDFFASFTN